MIYLAVPTLVTCLVLATFTMYERYFVMGFLDNFTLLVLAGLSLLAVLSATSLSLRRSHHSESLTRIWLALTAVAFTYGVIDVLAGVLLIPKLSPSEEPDPLTHHRLIPNSYAAIYHREYSYVQRINNVGMRGQDIARQQAEGVYRIAILGDSFTMGKGVEDDKTFSVLLQNLLTEQGRKVEVLNAGVDSYAPVLSYMQLKHRVIQLTPDLVVYCLDVADLLQEQGYRAQATFDDNGQVIAVDGTDDPFRFTPTQRIRMWINEHLYLSRLVVYYTQHWVHQHRAITIENVVGLANPVVLAHTLADDNQDRISQWASVFDSIVRMQEVSTEGGAEFVLAVYPWGHQVSDREWVPGRSGFVPDGAVVSDRSLETITEFALSNRILLLNLFPSFRAHHVDRLYYYHDMHWTPTGHQLAATEMAHFLQQNTKQ